MGIKKTSHIEIEQGRSNYENLTDKLYPLMKPYFEFNGKVDMSKNDPTSETSTLLAAILDNKIVIEDNENAKYFCADDILAKQIIVDYNLIKFWGIIYWLQIPSDHEINKTGQDPFYAEFRLEENQLKVDRMKFGDYNTINLDKVWWFDLELDWIYDFEE